MRVRSTEETAREWISGASWVTGQKATSSRFFGALDVCGSGGGNEALRTFAARAAGQPGLEGEGGLGAVRDIDFAQVLVAGQAGIDTAEHHVDFAVLKFETEKGEGGGDLFLGDAHGRRLARGRGAVRRGPGRGDAAVAEESRPSSCSQVRLSIRLS